MEGIQEESLYNYSGLFDDNKTYGVFAVNKQVVGF